MYNGRYYVRYYIHSEHPVRIKYVYLISLVFYFFCICSFCIYLFLSNLVYIYIYLTFYLLINYKLSTYSVNIPI